MRSTPLHREGTHTLFSASFDRTVKLWSVDDRAYMDSLYGHQVRACLPQCVTLVCSLEGEERRQASVQCAGIWCIAALAGTKAHRASEAR